MGSPTGIISNILTGRTALYTISSAVQTFDIPVLGETEGPFRLTGYLVNGSGGGPQVDLRPNGAAPANMNVHRAYNGTGDNQTFLDLCTGVGAGQKGSFRYIVGGKSGQPRIFAGTMSYGAVNSVPAVNVQLEGWWNDTSTVITSLTITGSIANTIGVGSWFLLECLGVGG